MTTKNGGMYSKILTIALCFGGGAVLHVVYERYIASTVFAAIAINALALAGLYIYLHMHYLHRRRSGVARIVSTLNAIKHDKPPEPIEPDDEFAEALETASALGEHFKELERTRTDILTLLNSVASNMEMEGMLNALLPKIIGASHSNWGAFYLANATTGKLELEASYGFSKNVYNEFDVAIGEGFVGMAALKRETHIVDELPDDSIFVTRTFLGKIKPKSVMAVPVMNQEALVGVLAIAAIRPYTPAQQDIVRVIQQYIGAAVANSVSFEHSKRLMSELKFQNALIRDLYDEMESKSRDAASRTDENARLLTEICGRAMDDNEQASALLDAKGALLAAGWRASRILTGQDGQAAQGGLSAYFVDPARMDAFLASADGLWESFQLVTGAYVSIGAYPAKGEDGHTRYISLKLELNQ